MIRCIGIFGIFLAAQSCLAESVTLPIPDQGWHVSFDAPHLTRKEEFNRPDRYKYYGTAGRFSLSLFVEPPGCRGGNSHQKVFECLWEMASENPQIAKGSVVVARKPNFYKVEYDLIGNAGGQGLKVRSVNYFFAYRGKWNDLHVSVTMPGPDDLKYLDQFEDQFRYCDDRL